MSWQGIMKRKAAVLAFPDKDISDAASVDLWVIMRPGGPQCGDGCCYEGEQYGLNIIVTGPTAPAVHRVNQTWTNENGVLVQDYHGPAAVEPRPAGPAYRYEKFFAADEDDSEGTEENFGEFWTRLMEDPR